MVDVKTYHARGETNRKKHHTSKCHNGKVASLQEDTRKDYAKKIGAEYEPKTDSDEQFVTFAVAIEGSIGIEAKRFITRLVQGHNIISNQDDYSCQLSPQTNDLFAGDIYASLCHVRASAALHQMQQWVQKYQTMASPDQAGHRSHATTSYGVRLNRIRGNNAAAQIRLARHQRFTRRR